MSSTPASSAKPGSEPSPRPHTASAPRHHAKQDDLQAIQTEIEMLEHRRKQLEQKRRELEEQSRRASMTSTSEHSANRPRSASRLSVMSLDHGSYIPSERERVARLPKDTYFEMKEAMKAAWEHDSTLVGGFFNPKDNPRNCTFGRSRRFTPIVGMTGQYYLSTDVIEMQEQAKSRQRKHYSVANRGKVGCNVNSHWNDPKGGSAPGPGAYTPRYQKLAPPVRH